MISDPQPARPRHARSTAIAASALLWLCYGCAEGRSIAGPAGDDGDAGEQRANGSQRAGAGAPEAGAHAPFAGGDGASGASGMGGGSPGSAADAGVVGASDSGSDGRVADAEPDAGTDAAASLCPRDAVCLDECHDNDVLYEAEAECIAGGEVCYPLNNGMWCRTELPDPCPDGYHQLHNATCDLPMMLPDCLRVDQGVHCAKD